VPSATELRELEDDELEVRLAEYRRELLNLRFQLATGQLDNVARLGQVRRDVARVFTILRDREIALSEGRFAGPVVLEAPARPPRPPRPSRRRAEPELEEPALGEEGAEEAAIEESQPQEAVPEPSAAVEEEYLTEDEPAVELAVEDEVLPEEEADEAPEEEAAASEAPRRAGRLRRRGRSAEAEAPDTASNEEDE